MAHIETREIPKASSPIDSKKYKLKSNRTRESISSTSNKSNSDSDAVNKDNEDPAEVIEDKADQFEPKELR